MQATEQSKRYDGLATHSKNISGHQDLSNFARNTPISANLLRIPKKIFAPPQPPPEGDESLEYNVSAETCLPAHHKSHGKLTKFYNIFNRTIYHQYLRTSSSLNVKHLSRYVHH